MTDLPQILIGDLRRITGMFLAWFLDSKLSGSTFTIAKIVIKHQARLNGGSNYEHPGQRWVPKLVVNIADITVI